MKTFFTAEAQRTQMILFFIKKGSRSDEWFSIGGISRQWKKLFSASSASLR
jgi:hypothetical protein